MTGENEYSKVMTIRLESLTISKLEELLREMGARTVEEVASRLLAELVSTPGHA